MSDRLVVRVVGPLAPYASAFDQELRSRGYTKLSAAQQLRLMAHLSQWLVGAGLGAAELTPERVEAFCVTRRDEGYTGLRTAKALAPLQAFLHEQGVLFEPAVPTLVSAEDRLLERYRNYLVHERGLTEQVVSRWVQAAGLFLAEYPGLVGDGPAVGAAGVSAFCVRELPGRGVSAAKNLVLRIV